MINKDQLSIAHYWFECILHMEDPGVEWLAVERCWEKAGKGEVDNWVPVW